MTLQGFIDDFGTLTLENVTSGDEVVWLRVSSTISAFCVDNESEDTLSFARNLTVQVEKTELLSTELFFEIVKNVTLGLSAIDLLTDLLVAKISTDLMHMSATKQVLGTSFNESQLNLSAISIQIDAEDPAQPDPQ